MLHHWSQDFTLTDVPAGTTPSTLDPFFGLERMLTALRIFAVPETPPAAFTIVPTLLPEVSLSSDGWPASPPTLTPGREAISVSFSTGRFCLGDLLFGLGRRRGLVGRNRGSHRVVFGESLVSAAFVGIGENGIVSRLLDRMFRADRRDLGDRLRVRQLGLDRFGLRLDDRAGRLRRGVGSRGGNGSNGGRGGGIHACGHDRLGGRRRLNGARKRAVCQVIHEKGATGGDADHNGAGGGKTRNTSCLAGFDPAGLEQEPVFRCSNGADFQGTLHNPSPRKPPPAHYSLFRIVATMGQERPRMPTIFNLPYPEKSRGSCGGDCF
jgi:hypothetical protein